MSVGPGGTDGGDIGIRWVPVVGGEGALDEAAEAGELGAGEETVGVGVEGLQDDLGVGGGESGHGVSVFVVVQTVGVVLVDKSPVFDTEVVEEGLGGIGHTDVFGGGLGAGGQFSGGDFSIAVSVAEVPEWLPVSVWDLNIQLFSMCHVGQPNIVLVK